MTGIKARRVLGPKRLRPGQNSLRPAPALPQAIAETAMGEPRVPPRDEVDVVEAQPVAVAQAGDVLVAVDVLGVFEVGAR